MAKAYRNPGQPAVTKTIEVAPAVPATITLSLTQQEAETLRLVCGCIGGRTEGTRRADTDAIRDALEDAGVPWLYMSYPIDPHTGERTASHSGSIHFTFEENLNG